LFLIISAKLRKNLHSSFYIPHFFLSLHKIF